MEIVHLPWLSRNLRVVSSSDPSLEGLEGCVLNETRRTVIVQKGEQEVCLPKSVIRFSIDGSETIDGRSVCQRPENRIHMNWRMK
ncbi:MAG: ribonuclease P protein subunit [Candidatus Thermoplasmatota archaeon]|jgi:RNase P/RNase MRP subunit p29|nr:ribonuclease P protein subunit [Candidatus Thermoplasmatota archaeon]